VATTHTLTGNVYDLTGATLGATGVRVVVVTNLGARDALVDKTTNSIHLGGKVADLNPSTGEFTIDLIDTSATDLNVAANTLEYEVRAEFVNPANRVRSTWTSGWFPFTADANLADITTDVEPLAVQSASTYAAAAAASAAEAEAISGLTGEDAAVAFLVENPSATKDALSATIGASLADDVAPVLSTGVTALGASDPFIMDMDSEGRLLRASGAALQRSTDNGDTWTTIHTFAQPLGGVRQMDNGELLVSTADNYPTNTVKAALWVSSGYAAGGALSFTKKLDATDYQQSMSLGWGYGGGAGVYAVSEYDSKAPGSRSAAQRAWITQDSGASWTQIYDHGNGSLSSRHIHGVAADPYRPGTVWLTLGDYTGSATGDRRIRVSRDYGATWTDVTTEHQPTAIMCFPDAVCFGTDNAPNGVLRIGNPAATPAAMILRLAYRINEAAQAGGTTQILTHVAERPFRAKTPEGHLTLLPYTAAATGYSGLLLGTYDGSVWFEVWRDSRTYAAARGATIAIGPTSDGEVIIEGRDETAGARFRATVAAAAAPGVKGVAARISKGVARAMPRRAFVSYNNLPGQTIAGTYSNPDVILDTLPLFREDLGGLYTRASDGTGIIVNRDATVRIEAWNGVSIYATNGQLPDTWIYIDATLIANSETNRLTFTARVRAGQKIRVVCANNNFTGALSGGQVLTLDAWESHAD
jgi:hypothetical protein